MHRLAPVLILTTVLWPAPAPSAAKSDPLGRDNPRSAVTAFLEACQEQNYSRAAQYLDLRHLSEASRAARGPVLAKNLEAILNSDPQFALFRLSRNPEGDPANDPEPDIQHLLTIKQSGKTFTLDLERVSLAADAAPVWLFAPDTVLEIPNLTPSGAPPVIARYLPPMLVSINLLETPLWKWLALLLAALFILSLSRLLDRLLNAGIRVAGKRFGKVIRPAWAGIMIAPLRVFVSLVLFRTVAIFVDPTAIARLYIGHAIELLIIWVISGFLIKLAGLFVVHTENVLNARGQYASRSMLHLARRVANVTIVVLAILTVLSNWGYNTTTLIAGLGVGGIAVALAAQQTIANVFGGVSVIGDQPIRIGDLGKFGDLIGEVEDVGMRSTRIRTPARTIVSVPNSNFASINIENFTLRDKMLFNTTLPVKRGTPDDQVTQTMHAIQQALAGHPSVEAGEASVRLTSLTSAALNLEIFCYVLTSDLHQFYRIQSELLLAVNQVLNSTKTELA
jgi:MscS family membrane protein